MSGGDIAEVARSFVGVPFHHAARSRHGMDCVGLLVMVARELGIEHTDDVHYPMRPKRERLHASLKGAGLAQVEGEPCPGDVLAFYASESLRVPYHVGILGRSAAGPSLIHAARHPGRVVEITFAGSWLKKHESTWRYPGASI